MTDFGSLGRRLVTACSEKQGANQHEERIGRGSGDCWFAGPHPAKNKQQARVATPVVRA